MDAIIFILNLPWTLIGVVTSFLSLPYKVTFRHKPLAIIVYVRSFWWINWLPGRKGSRGQTSGQLIQLGPLELPNDLEHELIHVEQAVRAPLIQPILYLIENHKHGYRKNRYEVEAYTRSKSIYKEKADANAR